jgi:hypothetical protein
VVHRHRQSSSFDAAVEDGNKRLGEELYSPGMNPVSTSKHEAPMKLTWPCT